MLKTLGHDALMHTQADYANLTVLLQIEWQYLHHSVTWVGPFMGTAEEYTVKIFMVALLGED